MMTAQPYLSGCCRLLFACNEWSSRWSPQRLDPMSPPKGATSPGCTRCVLCLTVPLGDCSLYEPKERVLCAVLMRAYISDGSSIATCRSTDLLWVIVVLVPLGSGIRTGLRHVKSSRVLSCFVSRRYPPSFRVYDQFYNTQEVITMTHATLRRCDVAKL